MNISLQQFLLGTLHAVGASGRTEAFLLRDARSTDFAALTAPQLLAELRTLADRAWVDPYELPPGVTRWRITARGESAAREQGL